MIKTKKIYFQLSKNINQTWHCICCWSFGKISEWSKCWPLESCKEGNEISSRNKGLHAHVQTNWWFEGDWLLQFRLCWLHWYQEIHFYLYFYASWWSCILEKCKAALDCYFQYGGWVCFFFYGYLAWLRSFIFRFRVVDSRLLKLYYENSVVVFMAKNIKSGSWS